MGQSAGINKELWAIQQTPQGDCFVAYMAGENIAEAFRQVAASQTEFDRWFKQQVQETTGADLNTPPPGPISEILADAPRRLTQEVLAERAQGGTNVAEQSTDAFADTPTKADIIERISHAWSILEGALAGSDEEALATPGCDGWSVKDHLAHLEGWERYLLALLERRSPSTALGIDLATYRSTEDDLLNELIREPTKVHPFSQVRADLRRTHERLLAVVAALPEGDLEQLAAHFQPDELADDTDSIAVWITHVCDEHLREHVDWIQRLTVSS